MAEKRKKKAHVSAFVHQATKDHLDELAKKTGRNKSDVLRLLIDDATPSLVMDIQRRRFLESDE